MEETLKEKNKRIQKERDYKVDVDKYILVHIDGRSFSRMIKNRFQKPFDRKFIEIMNETAIYLCENVQGAKIAYVQSDEISLLLKKDTPEGDIFFGGRMCKMQSIISSLATAKFNQLMIIDELKSYAYDYINFDCDTTIYTIRDAVNTISKMPLYQFDCKVWDVDSANDAVSWFLFRNIDCVRNSKQQAAQTWCSHRELLKHHTDDQVALLKEKHGIDWNEFAEDEKYGRIISKSTVNATREMEDGSVVEYERSVWTASPGTDLTNTENRRLFIENNSFFKE